MNTETKKLTPAYVAYETFQSFINTLHEAALPDHIDKSLMPSISGGARSHLMGTLRFLALIGEKGETQDPLRGLVNAAGDKDKWPSALAPIITDWQEVQTLAACPCAFLHPVSVIPAL